jgi:hypothetical protein
MYGELIEDLREGLAVSAENDPSILRGIKQAARQLLKTYDFRQAVVRAIIPIAAATDFVALPADAGKIKHVWLTTFEGGVKLYKDLKRRGEGQLPVYAGPSFYFVQGGNIYLDQPMPAVLATVYNLEVWYQSLDPVANEAWLSTTYQDALEHLAGVKLALKKRKTEAATIYGQLWQQDTVILARHVAELAFSDMDMGMGDERIFAQERYPA